MADSYSNLAPLATSGRGSLSDSHHDVLPMWGPGSRGFRGPSMNEWPLPTGHGIDGADSIPYCYSGTQNCRRSGAGAEVGAGA